MYSWSSFRHQEQRETLPEAAKSAYLKLNEVREKANLPVKREDVIHRTCNIRGNHHNEKKPQELNQTRDTCTCRREKRWSFTRDAQGEDSLIRKNGVTANFDFLT